MKIEMNDFIENEKGLIIIFFREFLARNYVSNNFIVSAAGNVNHEEVSQLVQKAFAKLPQNTTPRVNAAQPYFTPSTLYVF